MYIELIDLSNTPLIPLAYSRSPYDILHIWNSCTFKKEDIALQNSFS